MTLILSRFALPKSSRQWSKRLGRSKGGCLKTDETTGNTGNTGIIRTIRNYRGCHQILLINVSSNAPCSQCPQWFRVLRQPQSVDLRLRLLKKVPGELFRGASLASLPQIFAQRAHPQSAVS